jgi:hypothetical protein
VITPPTPAQDKGSKWAHMINKNENSLQKLRNVLRSINTSLGIHSKSYGKYGYVVFVQTSGTVCTAPSKRPMFMIKDTEQHEMLSFVPTRYTTKLTAQYEYIQEVEELT